MGENLIPFEIHITTAGLSIEKKDDFISFCFQHEAKPLLIELSKGDFISQPMFSKVVTLKNFQEILKESTQYSLLMNLNGFVVTRLKIEVPADCSHLFEHDKFTMLNKYFEWHGKIRFCNVEKLYSLCDIHKVHLSLNSLKNESDKRFITLREFGSKDIFQARIANLVLDLTHGNWELSKQQAEYCIYDNNSFLDNGWLPQ